ncbi:MAG TPA: hypothetical protein VLL98_01930 [Rickettsiales bacterium]|nr:hypothetical protein [Rickettsiales bacterium]
MYNTIEELIYNYRFRISYLMPSIEAIFCDWDDTVAIGSGKVLDEFYNDFYGTDLYREIASIKKTSGEQYMDFFTIFMNRGKIEYNVIDKCCSEFLLKEKYQKLLYTSQCTSIIESLNKILSEYKLHRNSSNIIKNNYTKQIVLLISQLAIEYLIPKIPLHNDLENVLKLSGERETKFFIHTMRPQSFIDYEIKRRFEVGQLNEFMIKNMFIIGSRQLETKAKPDRLYALCKTSKLNVKNCIVIGDSWLDYNSASNEMLPFIFVLGKFDEHILMDFENTNIVENYKTTIPIKNITDFIFLLKNVENKRKLHHELKEFFQRGK